MSIKNVLESEIDQVRLVRITDLHPSHAKTESIHRYSPTTVYYSIISILKKISSQPIPTYRIRIRRLSSTETQSKTNLSESQVSLPCFHKQIIQSQVQQLHQPFQLYLSNRSRSFPFREVEAIPLYRKRPQRRIEIMSFSFRIRESERTSSFTFTKPARMDSIAFARDI